MFIEMLSKALRRLESGLDQVDSYLRANSFLRQVFSDYQDSLEPTITDYDLSRAKKQSPSSAQWRVLDHCGAVNRIYALFEQFVDGQIAEWVEFSAETNHYSDLPERFKTAYSAGFAVLLANLHKVRYRHLGEEQVVKEYSEALSGSKPYKLHPECMNYHNTNLRLDDIVEIFARSSLENLERWVSNSSSLREWYQGKNQLAEQTKTHLKNLVQYRNDAAHGAVAVDEIAGTEQLISYSDFIRVLGNVFHDFVSSAVVQQLVKQGLASHIGIIAEWLSENVVIARMEGAKVSCGDQLFLMSENSASIFSIVSIQMDSVNRDSLVVAKATEVGLKPNKRAQVRSKAITLPAGYPR